jgi:hypothetical protein
MAKHSPTKEVNTHSASMKQYSHVAQVYNCPKLAQRIRFVATDKGIPAGLGWRDKLNHDGRHIIHFTHFCDFTHFLNTSTYTIL